MSKQDDKEHAPSQGAIKHDPETGDTKVSIGGTWVPITGPRPASTTEETPTSGGLRSSSVNIDPVVHSTGTTSGSAWTSTTSGGMITTYPPVSATPKKPDRKIVDFPKRVTKKVVIGFVEDDDDEIVWSAKLKILDFHIDFDNQDGEGRITLVTDIEDAGA